MQGPSPETGSGDPNFMLSLARGLRVLDAFAEQPSLSVADISRLSGLSRSSVGRCLYTLAALGYVGERDGRYALQPGCLPLACAFLTSTPLATAGQAIAVGLRDRLQETVSLAVLDHRDPGRIIYVARAERNQVIAATLTVGSRLSSHCTSAGRVLLAALPPSERERWLAGADLRACTDRTITDPVRLSAELDRVAAQRWSLVEEELEPGLRSLAVPVRSRTSSAVAALNVATFVDAHDREHLLETCLPELRAAAMQIERAI